MGSRAERFEVHTRHSDLKDFIEIADSFTNLGFCLVAGNSAYLNEVEKSKSVFAIVKLGEYISDKVNNSLDIFIGSENCINPTIAILRRSAAESGYKHTYIPFLLKSETSVDEIQIIKHQFNTEFTFALYTPYLCTNSNNGITRKFYEYIIRRKRVKGALRLQNGDIPAFDELDNLTKTILRSHAEKFSLYGDFSTISNEIKNLRKTGFNIFVGLTLNDDLTQILLLKRACLRANELLTA